MLIYRNKASGKYFIHIENLTDDEALFVLPIDDKDGKVRIKNLELNLFDEEPDEGEDEVLLERQLISEKQLEKYTQHREAVKTNVLNKMVEYVKSMTLLEKERIRKESGEAAEWLQLAEELIEQGWNEEK